MMSKKKGGKFKPSIVKDAPSKELSLCFQYFILDTIKDCSEKQLREFIDRLHRLCILGWEGIAQSRRHDYRWELLDKKSIKIALPPCVTPEMEKVYVFRYNNANNPFIAIREKNILRVLAVEANFGDLYNHG